MKETKKDKAGILFLPKAKASLYGPQTHPRRGAMDWGPGPAVAGQEGCAPPSWTEAAETAEGTK